MRKKSRLWHPAATLEVVGDFLIIADTYQAADLQRYCFDLVALNLGTGNGTSVLAALRAVEAVTGRRVPTVLAARRPGDPPALYADATMAARVLGWRPRFTAIEPMVEHAAAWFQKERQRESSR